MLIAIARYHQNGNNNREGETHITAAPTRVSQLCKMNRTKTGRMRDEFKAFGHISINPDFSLGMTARQEDLIHRMMTEQEESNPEQVKKAEKVLSWINKNYNDIVNVAAVEKKDGTHHGELGKSNEKETLIIEKKKFQEAAKKLNTVQNVAKMKVTPKPKETLEPGKLPKPVQNTQEVPEQKKMTEKTLKPNTTIITNKSADTKTEGNSKTSVDTTQSKRVPLETKNDGLTTLRKPTKTQTKEEADFSKIDVMSQLKSICIMESPWKTYHKVPTHDNKNEYVIFRRKCLEKVQ